MLGGDGMIGYFDPNSNTQMESLFHESFIFPEDTDEYCEVSAGAGNNVFDAWAELVDNNAVTFSSKITERASHISFIIVDYSLVNLMYIIELSYGDAHTIIGRGRFISRCLAGDAKICQDCCFGTSIHPIFLRPKLIPAGETVYFRIKCETSMSACRFHIRYHFHPC